MSEVKLTGVPEFNKWELVKTGVTSISYNLGVPGTDSVTVPHNLGYLPTFIAYFIGNGSPAPSYPYPNGLYMLPTRTSLNATGSSLVIYDYLDASIDTENLYIEYSHSSGASLTSPAYIKYYLFRQTSN